MNSTIIDLGFLEIKWYSVMILLGVIVGGILGYRECKKKGMDKDTFIDMVFYGLILSILGARIYYVLFNLSYYIHNPLEIFMVWHGGLAIHGGLITALVFLYFFTKKKKLNLLLIIDMVVVSIIIGQAIGRWGNFFNGEAYGREVTLEFLKNLHLPQFIIQGMYIDGSYREPTFLYESIGNIIGFIILLVVRMSKKIKTGTLTSIYIIWYGIIRCIIESFRSDSLMLGSIKMAQVISIIGIILGIILWIKSRKNELYIEDTVIRKK